MLERLKNTSVTTYYQGMQWTRFFQFCILALLLLGLKLMYIERYGNATPFWEQWDAEAESLYKPYLTGHLDFSDLLAPYNKDRIFMSRVLDLCLLKANGIWNPLLQQTVNACLHVAAIIFLTSRLVKNIIPGFAPVFIFVCLLLFSVPYSWENLLSGFQSPLYIFLFFGSLSLWLLSTKEPLGVGWWCGIVSGVLSFLSLAAGTFVFGVALFTSWIIFQSNQRRTPKQFIAIILLAIVFITMVKLTPDLKELSYLKTSSLSDFNHLFIKALSWPLQGYFAFALIRNLPSLVFLLLFLRKIPAAGNSRWFLFTVIVWELGYTANLIYHNGESSISSHFTDLFTISLLTNFAALLAVSNSIISKLYYRILGVIWISVILSVFFLNALSELPDALQFRHDSSLQQETNTRNYLIKGDTSLLKNKPFLHTPYPNADRLIEILSSKDIQRILPSNISPGIDPLSVSINPSGAFRKFGYYPETTGMASNPIGSYAEMGVYNIGKLSMQFSTNIATGSMLLPIAGYPYEKDIKVEVIEQGHYLPLPADLNPKESWRMIEIPVKDKQFFINAVDSSSITWVSIGNPIPVGKFDRANNWLLSHYYFFVLSAAIISILLFLKYGFISSLNDKPIAE